MFYCPRSIYLLYLPIPTYALVSQNDYRLKYGITSHCKEDARVLGCDAQEQGQPAGVGILQVPTLVLASGCCCLPTDSHVPYPQTCVPRPSTDPQTHRPTDPPTHRPTDQVSTSPTPCAYPNTTTIPQYHVRTGTYCTCTWCSTELRT